MRTVLTSRRAFVIVVTAIALATVGGLAALWPKGEIPGLKFTEGLTAGHTDSATVSLVTSYQCSLYATAECKRMVLKLTSGPDEGTTTQIDLGSGSATPDFSVGDELRVTKNRLPRRQPGKHSLLFDPRLRAQGADAWLP